VLRERSFPFQLKCSIRSFFLGTSPDAFFFPSRLYGAVAVSTFLLMVTFATFFQTIQSFSDSVRQLDTKVIGTVGTMLKKLTSLYYQYTGEELPTEAIQWATVQIDQLHYYVVTLADALVIGYSVGMGCAILLYIVSCATMIADFRGSVLQARRGIWQFNVAKVQQWHAFTFVGMQISNSMFIGIVISLLITPPVVAIAWPLTWEILVWIIKNYYGLIIALAAPAVINIAITKGCVIFIGKAKVIQRRYAFMAFDAFRIFLTIIVGFTKGLVRFILVIVSTLISLPRMDRSPFPAWVETLLLLDSGSKSYQGMIVMWHQQSNPVLNAFVWIVEAEAAVRRGDHGDPEPLGFASPKKKAVANRWRLALFLLQNPKLSHYRTEGIAPKPKKPGLVAKLKQKRQRSSGEADKAEPSREQVGDAPVKESEAPVTVSRV